MGDDIATGEKPLLVLLHAFGSSRRAWQGVVDVVKSEFEIFAPDLPGFGGAASQGARSLAETADDLAREISARAGERQWLVAGHSMGGKFATILAASAVGGLKPPQAVLLLAASPPSPEPMDADRRAEMIGWASDGRIDEEEARRFLSTNLGSPLPIEVEADAMADLMASAPEAWTAWLETGSKEDWSARVGTLSIPCTILVGSEDGDLGEAGQRATNMRVYQNGELIVEGRCGHLLPLERPLAVIHALHRLQRRAGGAATDDNASSSAAPRSA